jgi:hypothetical protein
MADEPEQPGPPPPEPAELEYQPLRDARREQAGVGARMVTPIVIGAFGGIIGVLALGFGVAVAGNAIRIHPTDPPVPIWTWLIFFALAGSALLAAILAGRHRQWLLLGLMLGCGLMSLIEGLCFAGQ